jgi:D-alanine--poly(phosphoribitol) ligase subunit 2
MTVRDRTLALLRDATGDGEAIADPEAPLLASGLLDSLAIVSLMVALEETFGITISPADFDREAWSTPRALVADVERRLAGMA